MRFSLAAFRRAPHLAVLGVGATALALGIVGSAYATPITGPFEVDDGTDAFAIKGYTYTANNATGVLGYGGNSNSMNATGVAGYVTSPLSVGVTGFAASTGVNAYGVYGFSNTGNGVYGVSNTSAVASIYGYNSAGGTGMFGYASGAGQGVLGISSVAYGVEGMTDATSTSNHYAGVFGEDNSSAGTHYGVLGSTVGGDGVYGTASGNGVGLYGASAGTGNAVEGHSAVSFGGYFESMGGSGLVAFSSLGASDGALLADTNGTGAEIFGTSGTASHPALTVYDQTTSGGTDLIGTYGSHGNETFIVQSESGDQSGTVTMHASDVQISGDLYLAGAVYQNCTSFPETVKTGCQAPQDLGPAVHSRALPAAVQTYHARQSVPTMEDFGEGQLVNGQAAIPLDRTFAATIDTSRPYLVFITPEGDSKGLYVASKTAGGFVVHESQSGHSTLAFQYRIVAHPIDSSATRLAPVARGVAVSAARNVAATSPFVGLHGDALKAALAPHRQVQQPGFTPVALPKRLPQPVPGFLKQH